MQLQGERLRLDASAVKNYSGTINCFVKTWQVEGIRGLQRGLSTAMVRCICSPFNRLTCTTQVRECILNFFRIGMFAPVLAQLHDSKDGPAPIYKKLAAGVTSGCTAALICNPLDLLKVRSKAKAHPLEHAASTVSLNWLILQCYCPFYLHLRINCLYFCRLACRHRQAVPTQMSASSTVILVSQTACSGSCLKRVCRVCIRACRRVCCAWPWEAPGSSLHTPNLRNRRRLPVHSTQSV